MDGIQAANGDSRVRVSPLVKWPGGKRALADTIMRFVPVMRGTYFEPFFGGGAVFFASRPRKAVLSDVNRELMNAYLHVRDNQCELLRVMRTLKNSEEDYYRVRLWRPRTPVRRAARTLYLSRLSFNGLHRVNLRGEFNVPYGHRTHLPTIDEEHLARASAALQGADLRVGDFELVTRTARSGDVLYFDPPYTVAHANNGFVRYNERIFSWQDQERLAAHALRLTKRGCRVIISNADHPSVRKLYEEFDCHLVKRQSAVAASTDHRREITECIFVLG